MDTKELLEAIRNIVKEETQELKDRMDKMDEDLQTVKDRTQKIEDRAKKIEDRTLKLEVTIENETNRNINLLMEGQSLNAEKLKEISKKVDKIDDIEADIFALKESTKHNKEEIETLKLKIG